MGRRYVKRQATPQAPVSETAMRQVLGCYETLHLICTFIDMPTLLHAQLVSKHWHDMISTSPLLQQNLFFNPRLSVNIEQPSTINPLLLQHFEAILKGRESYNKQMWHNSPAMSRMSIANMKNGRKVHKAFIRRDASWRRMLVAQPPITSIGYMRKVNGDEDWKLLPFPGGLRMGDLYDMVFQAIWSKVDEASGSAFVDLSPYNPDYYYRSDHLFTKWKEMPPMLVGSSSYYYADQTCGKGRCNCHFRPVYRDRQCYRLKDEKIYIRACKSTRWIFKCEGFEEKDYLNLGQPRRTTR